MNQEIASLFQKWNDALKTRDPKNVVALYDTDAILLPTVLFSCDLCKDYAYNRSRF